MNNKKQMNENEISTMENIVLSLVMNILLSLKQLILVQVCLEVCAFNKLLPKHVTVITLS